MKNIFEEIENSNASRAWALVCAFIAGGWDNICLSREIRDAMEKKFSNGGEIFDDAVNFSEVTKGGYHFKFSEEGAQLLDINNKEVWSC